MKIITYNIWNSEKNFDFRLGLLCNLLKSINADVVGLQEVRDKFLVDYIKDKCNFKYSSWKKYYDCEEGLAIFSNYPIIIEETNWDDKISNHNCYILRTVVDYNNIKIGVTNVHLDYESSLNREFELVKGIKRIEKYKENDYEILLGDFNSYPDSSIHRYLTAKQTLDNHATNWIDLAESYSNFSGLQPKVTLDFFNNPRWHNENILETPGRFDWIMLKSPYPKENPKLNMVDIIGDKRESSLTPSDHYGVICDINFRDKN